MPILFVNVTDPVAAKIVQSLSHPGGNVTGFTDMDPAIAGKWAELLKELVPGLQTIAMVYNPDLAPYAHLYLSTFENSAAALALKPQIVHVTSPDEYEPTIKRFASEEGCALSFSWTMGCSPGSRSS